MARGLCSQDHTGHGLVELTLLHDLLLGPKVRRILGKAAMERTAGDGLLLPYAALSPASH